MNLNSNLLLTVNPFTVTTGEDNPKIKESVFNEFI